MTRVSQFHPIWVPRQRLRADVSHSPWPAVGAVRKLRHRVTYQSLKGTQRDRHGAPSGCLGQRTEAAPLTSHRFTHRTPVTRDELRDTSVQRLGSEVGHHGTLLTRQPQTTRPPLRERSSAGFSSKLPAGPPKPFSTVTPSFCHVPLGPPQPSSKRAPSSSLMSPVQGHRVRERCGNTHKRPETGTEFPHVVGFQVKAFSAGKDPGSCAQVRRSCKSPV